MCAVQVISSPPHDCGSDGHLIALRLRYQVDSPAVDVTPFCDVCRRVFLPPLSIEGREADWLMQQVARARDAPDATEEDYERMYA